MYCRVFLNEDTYFDIIFLDGQIKIEDYGLGIASVIKVSYENGRIEVSVIGKKIGYFSLGEEKPHYYENAYTTVTEIRSYMQALVNQANGIDNSDQTNNVVMLRKGTTDVVYHSQTELHTHFIEMLNGEEFIKILFTMCPDVMDVPVGEDGHLIGYLGKDDKGNRLSVMDCVAGLVPVSSVAALKLAKELEMPMTSQGLFDDLSDAISKRNNLVDYVARRLQETMYPDETIGNIKARIYVALLKCSLELLKSQGIKYTEISYSNDSTIKKMLELLGEDASKYIDFSMLLSANRNSFQNPSYVSETKKNLRKLLDKGLVRGFDLMGEEKPLSVNDHNFNLETSLASFLDYVVPLLNKHDDTVLRLHMGENQNSYTNPIDSLQLIEEVVKRHSLVIPPPYIRLGHAVYFDYSNSAEYVRLLGKLGVVIEINASSNLALSNIYNLVTLPYDFYRKNKIPVVIASDGAGFYRTSPHQENLIGEKVDPEIPKFLQRSEEVPGVFKK